MKMKNVLLMLAFLAGSVTYAAADRFAVVDMEAVFRQYYKSRIAADTLRRQSEIYRNYIVSEQDKIREMAKDLEVARDAAQNLALSADARTREKERSASVERDLAARRAALNRYMLERNKNLSEIEKAKRAEILGDIRSEVSKQAAAAGYSFVLDRSGLTTSGVPAVIYHRPGVDLTSQVLKALNAGASPLPEKK